MDVITPGWLIVAAIVAIVAGFVFGGRRRNGRPPSRIYRCRGCGSAAHHDGRTMEAWRSGKTTFFCQCCHRQWLGAQPPRHQGRTAPTTKSGSGCLGIMVLVAALPMGLLWTWLRA